MAALVSANRHWPRANGNYLESFSPPPLPEALCVGTGGDSREY
ncbi:MAG: hypothetical protein WAN46_02730 [Gammaproteobacteria bacterium]